MPQDNRSWGYDRIVGALANLGYTISDQTVGNILQRHGLPPAPERKTTTTWKEFICTHMDVLVATDFFTAEVWTWGGLVTYYVLFFIHLGSRRVYVAGVTPHPNEQWMMQVARNITMEEWGFLAPGPYLIHDRDGKGSSTLNRGGVRLPRKQGSRHTSSWDAPQHNQERRMVMDPTTTFCPNLACPARGQIGQGNMGIHAQRDRRFMGM